MIETLLYVVGSHERHSEFTEEMYIPLRPIPREDFIVDVPIHWSSNRNWQTKELDPWKVTQ